MVLMFGQLSRRESLRDMMVAFKAHSGKAKFLGFGDSVTLSNLAKANQNRDYRIFEEYAFHMVELARNLKDTTIFNLDGTVYAFDSTTIEFCLAVFCWAKFRKKKDGIRIHTLYNVEVQVPAFFHITTASVHDSQVMKEIPVEIGSYYIFDRAYTFLCVALSRQLCRCFLRRKGQRTSSTRWSNGKEGCPKTCCLTRSLSLSHTRAPTIIRNNSGVLSTTMKNKVDASFS